MTSNVEQTQCPDEANGIVSFLSDVPSEHEDYNVASLDALYAAEEKHFWFLSRKQRILDVFNTYVSNKEASVLEVGAGTGNVARALQRNGFDVAVGEMHMSGLLYAKSYGIKNCYQLDLFSPPFSEKFDVVGMFDVLEHLTEDQLALECVASMLKPNGKVILTVPAHDWLWSRDDAIANHKRRYNYKIIKKTVESAGFRVESIQYFFITLLPLLLLRRFLRKDNGKAVSSQERNQKIEMNSFINQSLLRLMLLENKIYKWLPNIWGGSLIIVASKI